MTDQQSSRSRQAIGITLLILCIGLFDYATGFEVRVFPLYFLPVSVAASRQGRAGANAAAALSTVSWVAAAAIAGQRYTWSIVWLVNTTMQGAAFVLVGQLIARLHETVERERLLSRTDALTGLLNARAFHEDAQRVLALGHRAARPVTMAYVDLDHFKSVNDSLGHQAGDLLLGTVARILARSTRGSDLIARLGGDEFAILLPDTGRDEAGQVLERLREALQQALATTQSAGPAVTASIGALTHLHCPAGLTDLVRGADALMYEAKRAGKNRVHHEVAAVLVSPNAGQAAPPAG